MKDTPNVSIIIINYRTSHYVKDIVDDITKNTKSISFEIIVVDNSDDDEEFNKLQQIKSKVQIINAGTNIGFGRGNNLGAIYAKGDYLLFLNTDTKLIGDTIGVLYNYIHNNTNVGVVGPNMFTKDNLPNVSYELEEKNLKREGRGFIYNYVRRKYIRNFHFNHTDKPLKIQGYICGACLMVSKKLFLKVGGFDNDIFMYAEDSLLCYRLKNEFGLEIHNVPTAKIIHYDGGSFDKINTKRASFIANGNYIYYEKCFGKDAANKYMKKYIHYLKEKAFICWACGKTTKRQDTLVLLEAYKSELKKHN